MNVTRIAARLALGTAATMLATTAIGAPAAQAAAAKPLGQRSLAQVLAKDTSGFDHNGHDYDILTAAVGAVLKAKPKSPVGVLADGSVALTAFIPNDNAFRYLAADVTHKHRLPSERRAFTVVAGLGIDTVETVLLYHVVPGATIDARTALKSDGAKLKTATGATITVDVRRTSKKHARIALIDADRNDRNPRVVAADINKGNRQIAHGINRVLRPVDLP